MPGGSDATPPIWQGDLFWVGLGEPVGSEPGWPRPYVVVQNDTLNASRLNTVIVCAVTSNLKYAAYPGNVRLRRGEANLPRDSVVNVTQVFTIDKTDLGEWIGRLSAGRVRQVVAGLRLVLTPREI